VRPRGEPTVSLRQPLTWLSKNSAVVCEDAADVRVRNLAREAYLVEEQFRAAMPRVCRLVGSGLSKKLETGEVSARRPRPCQLSGGLEERMPT
jgi:hypothetical protein